MIKSFCRATTVVLGFLVVAACDHATAPHLTPAQLARHIDSLLVAAKNPARWQVVDAVEAGPAYGASPLSITVATASGRSQWHGFMSRSKRWLGSPVDSAYGIVVYSDNALTNVILAWMYFDHSNPSPVTILYMVTADTVAVSNGSGTMTSSSVSRGGPCELTPGLSPGWAPPDPTCTLATFTGSLSWTFPTASAEFRSISIPLQSFPGLSYQ